MSKIYKTTDNFPFDELTIGKPVSAPGGNFIIRYSLDEKPLYVQPPKCLVKQVLNKTGKRIYCDFVFQQENEQFIRWMENLENKSQQFLFKNKNQWFESDLDIQDIENSFTSPLKIYKSGKSYIVRTNIQSINGRPIVKIYDEDEQDILLDQIQENMNVMVILEIQGIRCSPRSFQIDIELKQMMVLKPDDLFNTCILKSSIKDDDGLEKDNLGTQKTPPRPITEPMPTPITESTQESTSEPTPITEPTQESTSEPTPIQEPIPTTLTSISTTEIINSPSTEQIEPIESELTEKISSIPESSIELCEVDFDLEEMSETDTISIKQRKDVYYEMYREALRKAKVAKDLALSAYLEAKHIKNKYMLDDISDEDEESIGDEEESNENQE